jgi:hypothetical protein
MSDTRIDGSGSQKLYESASDDPAKIAEDQAKADYDAKLKTTSKSTCEEDPERFPCAPPAKDRTAAGPKFEDLAKTMSAPKPKPDSTNNGFGIPTSNDATRTADAKDGPVAGIGHDGLSVYGHTTSYKKTLSDGSVVEGPGASVQVGMSTEIQAKTVRVTKKDGADTTTEEGPSAKFTGGFGRNDDGSIGYHAGAGVNVGSAQWTHDLDHGSFTLGGSEGVGGGVSAGLKTSEGEPWRVCGELSVWMITAGICVGPGKS